MYKAQGLWPAALPRPRLSRVAGGIVVVGAATALGQGAIVLAAPVLARLYDPAAFGLLSVYAALLSVLVSGSSLRFDMAVPIAKGAARSAAGPRLQHRPRGRVEPRDRADRRPVGQPGSDAPRGRTAGPVPAPPAARPLRRERGPGPRFVGGLPARVLGPRPAARDPGGRPGGVPGGAGPPRGRPDRPDHRRRRGPDGRRRTAPRAGSSGRSGRRPSPGPRSCATPGCTGASPGR